MNAWNAKKRNVLFVAHDVSLGGAQLCLLELIQGLDRQQILPIVVVSREGPFVQEMRRLNIEVCIVPFEHWIPFTHRWGRWHLKKFIMHLPSTVMILMGLIKKYQIDVVYTNTLICLDGAIAALLLRRRHIWHLHENLEGNNEIKSYLSHKLVYKLVKFLSDIIIVNSKHVLNSYFNGPTNKCTVVHNGVDTDKYNNKNSNYLKLELGITSLTKIVAIVGTIIPIKGHMDFFVAAKQILSGYPDCVFVVVGSGNEMLLQNLKIYTQEENISSHFYYLGNRADIEHIMASIDVLVLASLQEAFGRVIVEAMAASKPVVATRSGGPEEILEDGKTGFLVPIHSPESMATSVLKILHDVRLANDMGKNGRQRVESTFSLKKYIQTIQDLILSLTARC